MSPYGVPGLRKVRGMLKAANDDHPWLKIEVLLIFDWLPTVHVGRNQPLTAKHFWTKDMGERLDALVGGHRCTFRGRNLTLSQHIYLTQGVVRTSLHLADAVMEVFGSTYRTPATNVEKELQRVRSHAEKAYLINLRHAQFLMMLLSTRPEMTVDDILRHSTMVEREEMSNLLSVHDRGLLWYGGIQRSARDVQRCSPSLSRWHVSDALRLRLNIIHKQDQERP